LARDRPKLDGRFILAITSGHASHRLHQLLSLFGTATGNKLLELLDAQKAHLFISKIVVDEVLWNKLKKSSDFFSNLPKRLDEEAKQVAISDHLLAIDDA
jgi:hypothetical protein